MSIAEQKLNLTKSLLSIDDKHLLHQISHLIQNYHIQKDFWDELPVAVQSDIEEAQLQAKEGKGKSHQKVMNKYKKWL